MNHSYNDGEGLTISAKGTTELARACPNKHGSARARTGAQARLHNRRSAPVLSRSSPGASRCVAFVLLRGVSRDNKKSRNALYTVWHEGYTRYLFALIPDREIRRRPGRQVAERNESVIGCSDPSPDAPFPETFNRRPFSLIARNNNAKNVREYSF